ncbi:phosphoesterase [Mucilaginibacter sp. PPCGB 2223]|uniref:bifunctional YncE family protein/alkaline phosphatase family protein n=1 Tax=Mucilaginibacter sp. PPCGB 2223 TaxID=1886027 RepID=UPI0008248891|nr:phosphoesterase [Mucilaginibacter sp. PPCGB 2223]OCX52800.1 phosphoesterase [Mucilaginibacter sp. PPCGB 2223]
MRSSLKTTFYLSLAAVLLTACHTQPGVKSAGVNSQASYRIGYDDSTLYGKSAPYLMPYNRIIDPPGVTVYFGDSRYENHSLDCKLIPGQQMLVVEDRYGIAIINIKTKEVAARWSYNDEKRFSGVMSTFSGVQVLQQYGKTSIFWSAASTKQSYVMMASWDGVHIFFKKSIAFKAEGSSPLALPNELKVIEESGINYLYVVLNGNNQLVKMSLDDEKIKWKVPTGVAPYGLSVVNGNAFVTNWGGNEPIDTISHETAGVPYGHAYVDHRTGGISQGTVSVFDTRSGSLVKQIPVGLHPNAIIASPDQKFLYVANGNSDKVYVLDATKYVAVDSINIRLDLNDKAFIGDSPNGLATSDRGTMLYVSNGMDNAVAVVKLGANVATNGRDLSEVQGFIPTGAYPAGLVADRDNLYICNLEGQGARLSSTTINGDAVINGTKKSDATPQTEAFNSHHQEATVSIIQIPDGPTLKDYTEKVKKLNLSFRAGLSRRLPRKNMAAVPVPERIGEPSVFKHVIYIIKENRTYDQVLGDLPGGNGNNDLCIYGDNVTPNQHQLAKDFVLLDNYYASGKSSAEGHQWTDAGMVSDYVEKNVRAWFRSYPHVQTDAMVYNKEGFIWNNALDHGRSVRIYGEAATPVFDERLGWSQIYDLYKQGKPFAFTNYSTIARVRPVLAKDYPGYDTHVINDQIRADAFIKELKEYEAKPGDQWPELMVLALPADHTGGLKPGLPTPRAMVADNDLALGRIVEAISHSRFYNSSVIFVTEDDSQDGWDHVSAYRTTGNVISPYSRLQKEVRTNYNQTCMVRTIEQILGLPPMNVVDATALPMFDVFNNNPDAFAYTHLPNRIPLDEMNKQTSMLKGTALYYAKISMLPPYRHIDGGNDDLLNKMLWFDARGRKPYPVNKDHKADKDGD